MTDHNVEEGEASGADEVRSLEIFTGIVNKQANEFSLEDSQRRVSQIWGIVAEWVTQVETDKYVYALLPSTKRERHRAPSKMEMLTGICHEDPTITFVQSQRMAFVEIPRANSIRKPLKNAVVRSYIDVVIDVEGFKMFGVKKRNGKFYRNKNPFLSSADFLGPRLDDAVLGPLHNRLFKKMRGKLVVSGPKTAP